MSGGGSRVSIPTSARKMIQNIKEIADHHSDEEIYAMLIECSMDPNETAQKLLLQDTFHEVKRKRERRKENLNNKESAESRRRPSIQGRGGRGGRVNSTPRLLSHDAGGRRNSDPEKENGINQAAEKAVIQTLPTSQDTKTKDKSLVTSSGPVIANGYTGGTEESLSSVPITNLGVATPPAHTNKNSVSTFGTRDLHGQPSPSSSNCSVSTIPSSSSAICFSSLDPVLVPSNDSRLPGAAGAIKREEGSNQPPGEPNTLILAENNTASEIGSSSIQGKVLSKSPGAGKNQPVESSQPSPTLTHSSSLVSRPSSNYNSRPHQIIGPQKVGSNKEWKPKPTNASVVQGSRTAGATGASELCIVSVEAADQTQPETCVLDVEEATSMLQKKLGELYPPQRQPVILPNHIHVPESERTKLSFGSFGASFGVTTSYISGPDGNKSSTPLSEASQDVGEPAEEQASSNQNALETAEEGDYLDHSQSPTNGPENLSSGHGDVSSNAIPEYNEAKQKTALSLEGNQFTGVHTSSNYSFGVVPPMLGSQLAPFENSESQTRDVSRLPSFVGGALSTASPTLLVTQAAGLMQSSMAMTQQPVPIFRPPAGVHISHYPPNYIPYTHYFSPFYVPPPAIHQYLGNSAFPQQPQAGGVYPAPSAAAATGVKYSLPQYKPGTNTGNPAHFGMPSSYGPYSSSPAGYNPSSTATAGNATRNDDLTATQFKESSVYISGQQGEGSAVWVAAPGRDISNMPTSSIYNLPPQGQHMTFTPTQAGHGTFPGVYHPAQAVTAAVVHPLLQQSQSMAEAVDMVGPGGSVYQQPQQAQINWSTSLDGGTHKDDTTLTGL
ncbi:GBF-interacting protein 1-like isoform X5 [Juglans microcarpa x Juglans regia]|uniref:GBF-interacting protein 1-like isoform X5 n=1 Tax=Juglans microcarpa x Juglans regia TaxID=2249226 RepID=UPI001B7DDC72|nr:GBF-interacting protein 1-like isoform X5 [Juglans microcarpa x Juglans regia]